MGGVSGPRGLRSDRWVACPVRVGRSELPDRCQDLGTPLEDFGLSSLASAAGLATDKGSDDGTSWRAPTKLNLLKLIVLIHSN
jgi:hypothetical protein